MLQLVDTHCHIHDSELAAKYDCDPEDILRAARDAGVSSLIVVGTNVKSSQEAVKFADAHDDVYAAIGIHPHEAKKFSKEDLAGQLTAIDALESERIVAVGECGLDYFYHNEPEVLERQEWLFREQLMIAGKRSLPLIFHIRDAKKPRDISVFDDFLRIMAEFSDLRGVVHSFSADEAALQKVLGAGFYVGLNGIMTFTKEQRQLDAATAVPLERLVLETDAPFLTPTPHRGTMCEPKHVTDITRFLCEIRGDSEVTLAGQTTKNAKNLFKI